MEVATVLKNVHLVEVFNLGLVLEDTECVVHVSVMSHLWRKLRFSLAVTFQFREVVEPKLRKTALIFNQVELKRVNVD